MAVAQSTLRVSTPGRGLVLLTDRVSQLVADSGIQTGLCHLFLRHTSAGLILSENADPAVGRDLERYMARSVPDGDPLFEHDAEGPDDMPAHIRTLLAGAQLTIPVGRGRLLLGTWQGVYLWEHRHHGHQREIVVTVSGD
ncbi:MAG TPA: secondary thiamine-phosphate synthase enzyme YjbQ [Steroidobacteraceae bacterium]|nr:secondary thiamine-phosphate synthase enzyme YjbQ [Steroidobacteraceae bacterium]